MAKAAKNGGKVDVTEQEVIEYLKINGDYAAASRSVRERKRAAAAAQKAGLKVSGAELQKAADGFRALMDLNKASATEKWLKDTGLSVEALENHLELNILKSKFIDKLEKDGKKYQNAKAVKETIRELAYRDWVRSAMR